MATLDDELGLAECLEFRIRVDLLPKFPPIPGITIPIAIIPALPQLKLAPEWEAVLDARSKHAEASARNPSWEHLRRGQVWRWERDGSGPVTGTISHRLRDSLWTMDNGAFMYQSEFDRGEWTLVRDIPKKWEDVGPGQLWQWYKRGHLVVQGTITQGALHHGEEVWLLDDRQGMMSKSEFERGEWVFVRYVESGDGIPGPAFASEERSADELVEQAPAMPPCSRQRMVRALLDGAPLHMPDEEGRPCECALEELTKNSGWHRHEAESRIDFWADQFGRLVYAFGTWMQGGRTERDRGA